MSNYILVDGKPVVEPDIFKWAKWFEKMDRDVAKTALLNGAKVSTVFLGIDHNFGIEDMPVLWETMIFGGEHDGYQERYCSRAEAEAGHERAVKLAKGDS